MKKTEQLSARVSELAAELVLAEEARTGESKSRIIERCILQGIRSPEALKLIREYASKDPATAALLAALGTIGPGKKKN